MFGDEKGIPVDTIFEDSFSREVWQSTYKDYRDTSVDDTMMRVARYVASAEDTPELRQEWSEKFYEMLSDFKCTAGGRIYANAGAEWDTTLHNCVSGDTNIITDKGNIPARELEGSTVGVLTQRGVFKNAKWSSYGKQDLYRVTFRNGDSINATEDHEWIVTKHGGGYETVNTLNLNGRNVPFNGLLKFDYNEEEYLEGIKHGLTFGDGTLYKDHNKNIYSILNQFGNSRHLIVDYFDWFKTSRYKDDPMGVYSVSGLPKEYKELPSKEERSLSYIRGFIAGHIAADGCIDSRGHVMVHSANYDTLCEIRTLASHVGLPTISIRLERELNPFTGTPSKLWKLTFIKKYFYNDEKLVLKNSHKEKMMSSPEPQTVQTIKVVSVEDLNSNEEVFCCVEPETHTMTVGNGILTRQCFVNKRVKYDPDSIEGIYEHLLAQSLTLKSEGGWGENFSYIRPRGSFIHGVGVESPGAVKYMELFDKASDVITSGSGKKATNNKAKGKIRKGAMMSVLDVTHPDVIEFITAKQQPGRLTKFNVSVNCTDEFMDKIVKVKELKEKLENAKNRNDLINVSLYEELIKQNDQWDLKFPETTHEKYKEEWNGDLKSWEEKGYPANVYRTVSATWLWNLIMESTYTRAEPGVLFLDRANHFDPFSYSSEKIVSTNPSLPEGTLVHTKKGIFPIEKLEGNEFKVKTPDGFWANATCRLTGENKDLLKIELGLNKSIRCTKEHKWPVYDSRMNRLYKVPASDLKPGDLIPLNKNESIGIYGDMSLTYDEGFFVGYFVGDGWLSKRSDGTGYSGGITFGLHERQIAERVLSIINGLKENKSTLSEKENEICFQFTSTKFIENILLDRYGIDPQYKDIPRSVWTSNDRYIKGFVDGLLSADGYVSHVDGKKGDTTIILVTSREKLAKNFSKLLSFAGVSSRILYSESKSNFPNGKNYNKKYERWDVSISGHALLNFNNVFTITHPDKSERLSKLVEKVSSFRDHRCSKFIEVKNISEDGIAPKVWDISVDHYQHVFSIEYCYTSNCGEQTLRSGDICTLSSLNLTQFINENRTGFDLEKLSKYTKILVRFLDNVNSLSKAPLPEYEYMMRNRRRIGCGVLGWGSSLFILKIPFGSDKASKLRDDMMGTISRASYMASIDLAEEKGMFTDCIPEKHAEGVFVNSLELPSEYMDKLRETGIRNSSLLSIQPNGNCVTKNSIVNIGEKSVTIESLINSVVSIDQVQEGDIVRLNREINIPTFEGKDSFDSIYINGEQETLTVKTQTCDLTSTLNHKYLVKIDDATAEWVKAEDLKPGMKLIRAIQPKPINTYNVG